VEILDGVGVRKEEDEGLVERGRVGFRRCAIFISDDLPSRTVTAASQSA